MNRKGDAGGFWRSFVKEVVVPVIAIAVIVWVLGHIFYATCTTFLRGP